ncbi:sensor histidine kinase [Streptomyces sp. AJS327]|nr:sensor histidine kinase [Streptomyces sp. AJS327]
MTAHRPQPPSAPRPEPAIGPDRGVPAAASQTADQPGTPAGPGRQPTPRPQPPAGGPASTPGFGPPPGGSPGTGRRAGGPGGGAPGAGGAGVAGAGRGRPPGPPWSGGPPGPPWSGGPAGASRPPAGPRRRPSIDSVESSGLSRPRAPLEAQTWREIAHLLSNLFIDLFSFVFVMVSVLVSAVLSVTVVGFPLLALSLRGARLAGKLERARARALLRVTVDEPSPPPQPQKTFLGWVWAQLKDPVGWRCALYMAIRLPWAVVTFAITLPALLIGWPLLPWLARGLTNVDRILVRALLSPSDELERRIAELESDRGTVVDTAAADLRRIERDLHDGAQARLVALAMGLGLAKEKLLEDPEAAAEMVGEAHGEVKLALEELRDLARGIHPAILTDRGLGPALSAVASRCTVPVTVRTDLATRPAEAIEGIAYFTVSELLQNVSKHSGAGAARVQVWRAGPRLLVRVWDDGQGGASTDRGSGLAGLTERLDAVDGLLVVDSPKGGPTSVTAELPWRDRENAPHAPHGPGGAGRGGGKGRPRPGGATALGTTTGTPPGTGDGKGTAADHDGTAGGA